MYVGKPVKKIVALLGAALVWGMAFSSLVVAQSTGSLTGTIKDPSGAILPGTTVALSAGGGRDCGDSDRKRAGRI